MVDRKALPFLQELQRLLPAFTGTECHRIQENRSVWAKGIGWWCVAVAAFQLDLMK